MEVYDPGCDTWTEGHPLTAGRSGHASAVSYQHSCILLQGETEQEITSGGSFSKKKSSHSSSPSSNGGNSSQASSSGNSNSFSQNEMSPMSHSINEPDNNKEVPQTLIQKSHCQTHVLHSSTHVCKPENCVNAMTFLKHCIIPNNMSLCKTMKSITACYRKSVQNTKLKNGNS